MRNHTASPLQRLASVALALFIAASCKSGQDTTSPPAAKNKEEPKPTVIVPPKGEQYDGTPYWLVRSKQWPAVITWDIDSTGEYVYDSLSVRLRGDAVQSFVSGPKAKVHPLVCWFELTVRPLPLRLTGSSFSVDSVSFLDPIRNKRLSMLKMLSQERYTEKGIVRTRFTNNLALPISPELTEKQQLEPTLYITSVDKKTIVVHTAPISVSFITKTEQNPTPDSVLEWGPK